MLKKVLLCLLSLILFVGIGRTEDTIMEAEANPVLENFSTAITFYASFDQHGTADLSNGIGDPIGNMNGLKYTKGIYGQALRARSTSLIYDAKENINLSKSGALLMWVSPADDWTDVDSPVQLGFATIHSGGETLLLARQGGKSNGQALMAIFSPKLMNIETRALVKNGNTTSWKKGEWHLLAINWGKGSIELSVDGNSFVKNTSKSPTTPSDDKRENLSFAGNSTEKSSYLMDEVVILDRPLSNDEVEELYGKNKK